jgi:hypothetical protein
MSCKSSTKGPKVSSLRVGDKVLSPCTATGGCESLSLNGDDADVCKSSLLNWFSARELSLLDRGSMCEISFLNLGRACSGGAIDN